MVEEIIVTDMKKEIYYVVRISLSENVKTTISSDDYII